MPRPPSVRHAVVARLAAAGCVAADEEADDLLAGAPDAEALEQWLRRRARGEPLAWITGRLRFAGSDVVVDPGVYVPRIQSEELARRAAALLASSAPPRRAADLCTGAGVIAHHLAGRVPAARVVGVDRDRRAVACARRNAVPTVLGDLGEPLAGGAFAVVTAVAPYVPTGAMATLPADVVRYEPHRALDGGPDGLDVVRRVVADASRLLRPGGWLLVEVGGEQDAALAPSLAQAGFSEVTAWLDDDGDLRGVSARRVQ